MTNKINFMKNSPLIHTPLCIYIIMLVLYVALRGMNGFADIKWNEYLFIFLFFIAPFLSLFFHITLYRILAKEKKDFFPFIFAAIPGFAPGAMFGYGLLGMSHNDTIIGFLYYIFFFGLSTAFFFGLLGLIYNSIYIWITKKIIHKV